MSVQPNTTAPSPGEDSLQEIITRHELDAMWFNNGLHDPNGYVVMAHKDRGALLERLKAPRTGHRDQSVNNGAQAALDDLIIWGKPRA